MLERLARAIPKFETNGTAATTGPDSNPDFRRDDGESVDGDMNSQSSDGSGSLEPITPPEGMVPGGRHGVGNQKDAEAGKDGGAGVSHLPSAHRDAAHATTGAGVGSGRAAESVMGAGGGKSPSAGRLGTIASQGDAIAAAEHRRLQQDGRQNSARRQMVDPRRHQHRGQESGEGTSEIRPRPHVNAQSNLGASLEHYHQRLQSPRTTRPESRMSITSTSSSVRPGNGDAMSETEDFADPIVGDPSKVGDETGAYLTKRTNAQHVRSMIDFS